MITCLDSPNTAFNDAHRSVLHKVKHNPIGNVFKGGMYYLQLMDWYCATFSLMLVGTIECLLVTWVYGKWGSFLTIFLKKDHLIEKNREEIISKTKNVNTLR